MQPVYNALTEEEAKILDAKYSGRRIKDLEDGEVSIHAEALLARIHIITGWKLPENEILLNALNHEFGLQLKSRYINMTIEEIALAMREYGVQVKDWGKAANLSLIDEPIQEYLSRRANISKLEEQKQPEPPKEVIPGPTDWSDTWEKLKQGEIKGILFDLTPWAALYDWAEKTGLFASLWSEKREWERQKWRWMDEVRVKEINRIGIRKEALQATPDERAEMERLKATDWRTDQKVTSALISKTKEHAVKQLLLKLKSEQ